MGKLKISKESCIWSEDDWKCRNTEEEENVVSKKVPRTLSSIACFWFLRSSSRCTTRSWHHRDNFTSESHEIIFTSLLPGAYKSDVRIVEGFVIPQKKRWNPHSQINYRTSNTLTWLFFNQTEPIDRANWRKHNKIENITCEQSLLAFNCFRKFTLDSDRAPDTLETHRHVCAHSNSHFQSFKLVVGCELSRWVYFRYFSHLSDLSGTTTAACVHKPFFSQSHETSSAILKQTITARLAYVCNKSQRRTVIALILHWN